MNSLTKVVPTHVCCICLEDVTEYVQCDVCLEGILCRHCALIYDVEVCPICRQINTNIRKFKSPWKVCFESCIIAIEIVCVTSVYFAIIIGLGALTATLFDVAVYDALNYLLLGLLATASIVFASAISVMSYKLYNLCKCRQKQSLTEPLITPTINPTHSSQIRIRLNY